MDQNPKKIKRHRLLTAFIVFAAQHSDSSWTIGNGLSDFRQSPNHKNQQTKTKTKQSPFSENQKRKIYSSSTITIQLINSIRRKEV